MSLTAIIITVIVIIGFIIWSIRKITERNRINRLSEEKKQGENLRLKEITRLRTEERISQNQKDRILRAEQETNAVKAKEERDRREKELMQKIENRKKREAEEKQRKAGDEKVV